MTALAQIEKNARIREAFGISEYFVDGSSFDATRNAKEKLAKSESVSASIATDKENQTADNDLAKKQDDQVENNNDQNLEKDKSNGKKRKYVN